MNDNVQDGARDRQAGVGSWWEESGLRIKWGNIVSFRLWLAAGFMAAILGYLSSLLWEPLGTVVFYLALPIFVLGGMLGTPLYCPHCGKRVKAGHAVCHHCGRDTE